MLLHNSYSGKRENIDTDAVETVLDQIIDGEVETEAYFYGFELRIKVGETHYSFRLSEHMNYPESTRLKIEEIYSNTGLEKLL